MLTAPELKIVFETLAKRRTWLLQTKDNLDDAQIKQNQATAKLLDSAIDKLKQACTAPGTADADPEQQVDSEPATEEALPDLSHLRVLLAEDDPASTELIKNMLQDISITEVDCAPDGTEALKLIFQVNEPYDLVLCDWNMPGKSGLEVHSTMRTDTRFNDVIFILVSAISEGQQIRTAIQQGVDDYIVKPLDEEVLTRKIARAYQKLQEKKEK